MRTRASITTLFLITVITAGLMILSVNCGGKNSSTNTKTGGDGRVYLKNGSPRDTVDVKYFNEELSKDIETVIAPGDKKEVSQALIKQGTKVKFTLTGKPPVYAHLLSYDVEVVIDGNVTIYVKSYDWNNIGHPFDYSLINE